MRNGLGALGLCVAISAGTAGAAQKIYEGTEAAALRCANIVALTAVALSDAGRLGEIEKEVMLGISFLMLEEHVSGTWPQKRAALGIVRDRRGVEETLRDFELLAEQCLRDFPIN
ncbi:MAG: hypothetical protein AAF999_03040 [Pseudomonadota bacterium]